MSRLHPREAPADDIPDDRVSADAQVGEPPAKVRSDCSVSEWPVFIVGCHRSGTTLVRYLFDAHPAFACPPETKFLLGIDAFLTSPQVIVGLQSIGVSPERLLSEFRCLTERFLQEYAARQGKRRWAEKTPNYWRLLPLIDRMFASKALYVLVFRHPLDTIHSLSRTPAFALDSPEDPDIAAAMTQAHDRHRQWAHYWLQVNEFLLDIAKQWSDRSLVVRYEDLVAGPTAVLDQIFRFVGEEYPRDLVERAFQLPHTDGYQDWKIRSATGIYDTSLSQWKRWTALDATAAWEIVRHAASQLGYEGPE
jgi:hypothetical protein